MRARRAVLGLTAVGAIVSAAQPAASRVGAPVDIEGGGHVGSASGGWACGPNASVKYGGASAHVRVRPWARSEEAESKDQGVELLGGAAVEARRYTHEGCDGSTCAGDKAILPPGGPVGGARVRTGYDWRGFGIGLSAVAWQHFARSSDAAPTLLVIPALDVRVGHRDTFYGAAGLGSYDGPTLLRPGAYVGLGMVPTPGLEIVAHGGAHAVFDGELGLRGDLTLKMPVASWIKLGVGAAASSGLRDSVEPEGHASLSFSL